MPSVLNSIWTAGWPPTHWNHRHYDHASPSPIPSKPEPTEPQMPEPAYVTPIPTPLNPALPKSAETLKTREKIRGRAPAFAPCCGAPAPGEYPFALLTQSHAPHTAARRRIASRLRRHGRLAFCPKSPSATALGPPFGRVGLGGQIFARFCLPSSPRPFSAPSAPSVFKHSPAPVFCLLTSDFRLPSSPRFPLFPPLPPVQIYDLHSSPVSASPAR